MPRAATTSDVFNAVAEPRRREILEWLGGRGEQAVTDIVEGLGWPQPTVSKHLAVLREVGLVAQARRGRQRMYSLDADGLKTVHDWVSRFERFWEHQLDRVQARAERLAQQMPADSSPNAHPASHPPSHPSTQE